jgi:hypothetical protein
MQTKLGIANRATYLFVRIDRVRLAVLEHEANALDRVTGEVALLARLWGEKGVIAGRDERSEQMRVMPSMEVRCLDVGLSPHEQNKNCGKSKPRAHLEESLLDRRNELLRNDGADDGVLELVLDRVVGGQRLNVALHAAVLTAAARLLLVQVVCVGEGAGVGGCG